MKHWKLYATITLAWLFLAMLSASDLPSGETLTRNTDQVIETQSR